MNYKINVQEKGMRDMADYRELYFTLFRALSKAIEELECHNYGNAEKMLKQAQLHTEEQYIEMEDE